MRVICSAENPRPWSLTDSVTALNASASVTRTGEPASENLKAFCTSSSTILLKIFLGHGHGNVRQFK